MSFLDEDTVISFFRLWTMQYLYLHDAYRVQNINRLTVDLCTYSTDIPVTHSEVGSQGVEAVKVLMFSSPGAEERAVICTVTCFNCNKPLCPSEDIGCVLSCSVDYLC